MPGTRDRRRDLLDAARSLFAERPYDQVTTTEIAKRAGVAYGLISHHFDNKRGIYLAVMNEIADEIAAAQLQRPPAGSTVIERLRFALRNHVQHIDRYGQSFVALERGQLGADPQQREIVENLRWRGAVRVLKGLGVSEPLDPTLRVAMHGWVGYLDEMMIDRINNGDTKSETVAELALAALVDTLRTVQALDVSLPLAPSVVVELSNFRAQSG